MNGFDYVKMFSSLMELSEWIEKNPDVKDYRIRNNPSTKEITIFYNKQCDIIWQKLLHFYYSVLFILDSVFQQPHYSYYI